MDALTLVMIMLNGLWLFLPAMVPNSAAALFGGGTKMDFGRTWGGKRIFGDGKSWRGFFGGVFSGIVLGLIMMGISALFGSSDHWGFGSFAYGIKVIVCLSLGAILGDLMGAFIKRRIGLERGAKAPILDQYDFVFGAFLLTSIFCTDWVYSTYVEGWNIVALVFLLLIMFAIHRSVNIVGYKAGIKKEPW